MADHRTSNDEGSAAVLCFCEECTRLKPCPFCGCRSIDPEFWMSGDDKQGPGCNQCGATAESEELWERRV